MGHEVDLARSCLREEGPWSPRAPHTGQGAPAMAAEPRAPPLSTLGATIGGAEQQLLISDASQGGVSLTWDHWVSGPSTRRLLSSFVLVMSSLQLNWGVGCGVCKPQ